MRICSLRQTQVQYELCHNPDLFNESKKQLITTYSAYFIIFNFRCTRLFFDIWLLHMHQIRNRIMEVVLRHKHINLASLFVCASLEVNMKTLPSYQPE